VLSNDPLYHNLCGVSNIYADLVVDHLARGQIMDYLLLERPQLNGGRHTYGRRFDIEAAIAQHLLSQL
jgi:hypothetical protein